MNIIKCLCLWILWILLVSSAAAFTFGPRRFVPFRPYYDWSLHGPLMQQRHRYHEYPFGSYFGDTQLPKVSTDLKELEGHYQVHVDVPGINKDELNIDITNNVLRIHGERRMERPDECENIARDSDEFRAECEAQEEKYHHQERYYGEFETELLLPDDIVDDLSAAKAKYVDGVLLVEIPKKQTEAAKVKVHKIKIS
mmetsp:Transcript_44613/g.71397  ORF Transcript_44613/g.71397 Transcript_44613/m.71397 type:complete len:197 (+) Transcript_44613:117-707(+)